MRTRAALVAAAIGLAGCGTGSSGADTENGAATATDNRQAPNVALRCLDVDAAFLAYIWNPELVGPVPLTDGQAVKARGFDNVYFVSAYYDDKDNKWPDNSGIAIFWTNRFDENAMVWTVNERAGAISDWGYAGWAKGDDPVLSIYSDGATESFECVEAMRAGG